MSSEDQFKNKVKNLVDKKQFRYEPSSWEYVANQLDKQERKKKLFYLTITAVVLLSVMGLLLLDYTGVEPYQSQITKHVELNNQITKETEKKIHSIKTKNDFKSTKKTLSNTNSSTESDLTDENKPEKKTKNPFNSSNNISNSKTLQKHLPIKLASKNKDEKQEVITNVNHKLNFNADSSANRSGIEKSLNNQQLASTINVASTLENYFEPPILQSQVHSTNTDNKFANQKEIEITDTSFKLNRINTSYLINDTSSNSLSLRIQKVDSNGNLIFVDEPIKKTTSGFIFYELGTYFNTGWKYNNKQEALGFNFYSGIGYSRKLANRVNISLGAYYAPVSHLKASKKIKTNYAIYFGEQTEITEIKPLTLNYIQVPFTFQYLLANNHGVSIGYAFNYLLDVRSRVDKYTEELHTQFDKSSTKTYGYTDGFTKASSSLMFGYRFKFNKNIWINNQIIFGLTELRQNDIFINTNKEKIRGMVVTLNYNFLNK